LIGASLGAVADQYFSDHLLFRLEDVADEISGAKFELQTQAASCRGWPEQPNSRQAQQPSKLSSWEISSQVFVVGIGQ